MGFLDTTFGFLFGGCGGGTTLPSNKDIPNVIEIVMVGRNEDVKLNTERGQRKRRR